MNEMSKTVEELQEAWTILFRDVPPPDSRQWALWITLHGQFIVRRAIAKVAVRYQRLGDLQQPDSLYRFASALMAKMTLRGEAGAITNMQKRIKLYSKTNSTKGL